MTESGNAFGPQVSLTSKNVAGINTFWNRFKFIHLPESKHCICWWFNSRIALVEINVCIFNRTHYTMMFGFGCSDTSLHSAPAHYGCIGSKTSFKYLIPADKFFTFCFKNLLKSLDEITLKFILIF